MVTQIMYRQLMKNGAFAGSVGQINFTFPDCFINGRGSGELAWD